MQFFACHSIGICISAALRRKTKTWPTFIPFFSLSLTFGLRIQNNSTVCYVYLPKGLFSSCDQFSIFTRPHHITYREYTGRRTPERQPRPHRHKHHSSGGSSARPHSASAAGPASSRLLLWMRQRRISCLVHAGMRTLSSESKQGVGVQDS